MIKRIALALVVYTAAGCAFRRVPPPVTMQGPVSGPQHAHWDGHVWSCPTGTYVWVDEVAAREDERAQNYVYCVRMREMEE